MSDAGSEDAGGPLESVGPEDTIAELAGNLVNRLFAVGLSLEGARGTVRDGPAAEPIAAAIGEVDRVIRDIRTAMFTLAASRPTVVQERIVRTARAMQQRALDTAAVLERQAIGARYPVELDYPTEIKRWRAFADQAEQIATRWEQAP